jgi:FkbM family methyltransferase
VDARQRVKEAAVRVGAGPLLERVVADHWPSRTMRRERRDNRHALVALAAVLEPDSHVIDVGANYGVFLDAMRRLAPVGRAIACEPIPDLAAALAARCPSEAVTVHNCAISDEAGEATFFWVPSAPAVSGLRMTAHGQPDVEELSVRVERLDDLVPSDFEPRVLKIDVEGAELGVLRGARELLRRSRPLVILEHGAAAAAFGTSHEAVYDELTDAGLRIYDMDGAGPYARNDFAVRASSDRWNWIAR